MDSDTLFTLGTVVNRSMMIATGALSIWLGYRLFSGAPSTSNAEISIKDHIKLNLFQIGPGVFFCLGGTAILLYHLHMPATFARADKPTSTAQQMMESAPAPTLVVAGASGDQRDPSARERGRVRAQQDIDFLNQLTQLAAQGVVASDSTVRDFGVQMRELKLDLMQGSWVEQWGDSAEFAQLVRSEAETLPERYPEATAMFGRVAP